jgi:cytochrome P450
MQPVIFYQSAVLDPYVVYVENAPICWDDTHKIWGVYSYKHCRFLLEHASVSIPPVNAGGRIIRNLARLSNGPAHTINREAAVSLFKPTVRAADILPDLLPASGVIDWVETVCKKLPALIILRSAGFSEEDSAYIVTQLAALTKLMVGEDAVAEEVFKVVEKYYRDELAVSNFIGLLIQSYDAGRGLLSNILLKSAEQTVMDSLRFTPPIHNTRRVANEDILLDNHLIKKGDMIMLVLAAANLETEYPILTFGTGIHACIASQFAVQMATDTLQYCRHRKLTVLPQEPEYEPLINARLIKQLFVSL